jgi:hypothetical protein
MNAPTADDCSFAANIDPLKNGSLIDRLDMTAVFNGNGDMR